jgi:hypothetical protein
VCLAARLHHDCAIFQDPEVRDVVARLIAPALVAEVAIQRFAGPNSSTEWAKGGDQAAGALMLYELDLGDCIEQLLDGFALGIA